MKRTIIAFVAAVALFVSSGFSPNESGNSIIVKKGKFTINNVNVTPAWNLAPILAVLGEDARKRDGYNTTYTYDNKGMVAFEPMKDKKQTGLISEFQTYFSIPEPNNVTPSKGFVGTIKIDKLVVTAALTPAVMMKKLKGWNKTDSYLSHSYRMASKGLYIYFQFNDDETSLVKISIGPDKRGK